MMLKKVEEWINEQGMLPEHSSVIAAVSGGADSVCLLALLLCLAPAYDWKVKVFHLNHLIRGEEAERDENFVRVLCEKWQTNLLVVRRDVPAFARDNGLSLEEAGRKCRRSALESAAADWEEEEGLAPGTVRIAMAHHADDNAETILHHLMRGSGLRGLGGIHPVQGRIVRPLLCVRRGEIHSFLEKNNISWCEDSTNSDTAYTRNRIRNEIIPMMEREINPRAVDNIIHAGTLMASADSFLMSLAEDVFAVSGSVNGDRACINLSDFLKQNDLIRSYILRFMIDLTAPDLRDLTSRHFEMMTAVAQGETGKRVDLPGGLMAGRDYDTLWIRPVVRTANGYIDGECMPVRCRQVKPPDSDASFKEVKISAAGESLWEPSLNGGKAGEINFKVFLREQGDEIPKNKWSKWFDYDKIIGALSVRTRRSGDYLTIAGGAHKSLSRFFIDEKVPRDERDKILLLADGNHILWVVGMRISEYYKVTAETKLILQAEKKEG